MTDQERRYFTLPNGDRLPLPYLPNLAEFQLPGNFREYPQQEAYAFYDDDTRTGAIYRVEECAWRLVQPCTRQAFWEWVEANLRFAPFAYSIEQAARLLGQSLPRGDGHE